MGIDGPNVKYVYIAGYLVVTGGYDDEGVSVFGGIVSESRVTAERDLAEAKEMGFDDAQLYMLIDPDTFPRADAS
jgi:hypothetical protein